MYQISLQDAKPVIYLYVNQLADNSVVDKMANWVSKTSTYHLVMHRSNTHAHLISIPKSDINFYEAAK